MQGRNKKPSRHTYQYYTVMYSVQSRHTKVKLLVKLLAIFVIALPQLFYQTIFLPPPALPMLCLSSKLLAILLLQLCLSAVLSNYLPASLQICLSSCLLFFCYSSASVLFYQTICLPPIQPCLSGCLLLFCDSSASALFYQTICLPPSSHTHALLVKLLAFLL